MTSRPPDAQPLLRANDWTVLRPPAVGAWAPTRSVSVVIPAHDPVHLPLVLAALSAQTYPAHLLEVVVVDDGSQPPVELPSLRPEHTRLVHVEHGWGRAAACQQGADRSDGDVLHWLDADMVVDSHEVETQLRWHHLIDYAVVLGHKLFSSSDALDHLSPAALRDELVSGASPTRLATGPLTTHEWVERIQSRTRGLAGAGPRAMRVHVGASASVGKDLFRDAGGMPVDLVLGEDIVLGYRLREAGAVFIPDSDARGLHLGDTAVMRRAKDVNRYNRPFIADRVPEFRAFRSAVQRSYEVPYAEIVLPVEGAAYDDVRCAVDHQLAGRLPDLVVTLVADWSSLSDKRRSVLADDRMDLRMIRAAYGADPRIRLHDTPTARSDATFRITLPSPAWFPVGKTLKKHLDAMEIEHTDAMAIHLPDGAVSRLERTASLARSLRCPGADRDPPLVAPAEGWLPVTEAPRIRATRGLVGWETGPAGGDA